ncbi:hypothetical protein ACFQ0G_44910 [Streptomyces chiangmaiensis]|uniref:hypothetical protein n=1 Tax=Streptomyces chiangmaiensis TaxID=766497 RepID=UPI0031ED2E93
MATSTTTIPVPGAAPDAFTTRPSMVAHHLDGRIQGDGRLTQIVLREDLTDVDVADDRNDLGAVAGLE